MEFIHQTKACLTLDKFVVFVQGRESLDKNGTDLLFRGGAPKLNFLKHKEQDIHTKSNNQCLKTI